MPWAVLRHNRARLSGGAAFLSNMVSGTFASAAVVDGNIAGVKGGGVYAKRSVALTTDGTVPFFERVAFRNRDAWCDSLAPHDARLSETSTARNKLVTGNGSGVHSPHVGELGRIEFSKLLASLEIWAVSCEL